MAERPDVAVEAASRVGVVEIDRLGIGHHELDLAKRVAGPRRLPPALDLAVRAFDRNEAFLARGFLLDALGYFPPRVEDHADRRCRQLRSGSRKLARDGPVLPPVDAVLDQRRVEARHVDDDIFVAEVARQPAPAVHVEADSIELGGVVRRRVGESGLQRRILRVGGKQGAQSVRDPVLGKRAPQKRILLGSIEVVVDRVPVDPHRLANMAHGKVPGHAIEAVGRLLRQSDRVACANGGGKPGGIVICWVQTFDADLSDVGEQILRIAGRPHRRR